MIFLIKLAAIEFQNQNKIILCGVSTKFTEIELYFVINLIK